MFGLEAVLGYRLREPFRHCGTDHAEPERQRVGQKDSLDISHSHDATL
jgi:hypothetical protein